MTREMVDSAFPLGAPPPGGWRDIILIYAGGDTVHAWTTAEILAMPARYRWPCWVRSNPSQVRAVTDAANFVAWLQKHGVPEGTCVILDLETAVDLAYVTLFNQALRAAGYKVTKYGSTSTIFRNPKTDGGTFVAEPGSDALTTVGDTVARQYGFDGSFDLSIVKDQASLPLWDTKQEAPMAAVDLTPAALNAVRDIVWQSQVIFDPAGPAGQTRTAAHVLTDNGRQIRSVAAQVAALSGQDDPAALAKAILAGLDASQIASVVAAAVSPEIGKQLVAALEAQFAK